MSKLSPSRLFSFFLFLDKNSVVFFFRVLEKHPIKNLYGEETVKYIVGIFEQDETVSQGCILCIFMYLSFSVIIRYK